MRPVLLIAFTMQDIAPREPTVRWQMGKIHKVLGHLDAALAAFNAALDLKPSAADSAHIKSAIERLHVADDKDEDEL